MSLTQLIACPADAVGCSDTAGNPAISGLFFVIVLVIAVAAALILMRQARRR